jgi:hypothetical protein
LQDRSSVIYKYGCSDEAFHYVGAMPFLFWQLIQESKDRFGATKRSLDYYRYPESPSHETKRGTNAMRRLLSILPDTVACTAGRVLYRHIS